jgi:hypothetical protein
VIAPPATSGAAVPNANLRAFLPVSAMPARRAFHVIAASSTTTAMDAAPSHVASQRSPVGCRAPTTAAISPMTPVTTPPAPGTAVKADERSIADRMYVRSSAAQLLIKRGWGSGTTWIL